METQDQKRDFVKILLANNIVVGTDLLSEINKVPDFSSFYNNFNTQFNAGQISIDNSNIFELIGALSSGPSQVLPEQPKISAESPEVSDEELKPFEELETNIEIVSTYEGEPKKREVQDFVSLFNQRYNSLKSMLMKRKELDSPTSISRASQKSDKDEVAVIGMISERHETKNGHMLFTIEDPTGTIKVLVNKNKPEMLEVAKDCGYDEVIGVTGPARDGMMFANNFIFPDIPLTKELKKAPDDVYVAFLGDMHFGSNVFMHDEWEKFLSWIRAEKGSDEQKELARKIRYMFIAGDLVEGVGIYPGQENDLEVKDIYEQYRLFAEYLKRIPPYINIIICPGNHDAMRIAEPQPPLYKDFAGAIYELPNVTIVSNPSIVNIHKSEDFPGIDVMMYHGFSFIYYSDNVQSVRAAGGQKRSDLIMKYLLQRRHLAPAHTSTLYLPDADKDNLLIEKVPDILVSGHIHRVGVYNYRNVQMTEVSCWIRTTEFQEKMGLQPQPGRVPIISLKTRKPRLLKFSNEEA